MTVEQLLQQIGPALIAVVVPMLVFGVRKAIPTLPKAMLPILAAVLGPAVEAGIAWLGGQDFTGTLGLAMGLAGVGLREIKDQVGKALFAAAGDGGSLRAAWPATLAALALAALLVGCATNTPPPGATAQLNEAGEIVVVDRGAQVSIDVSAEQGLAIFCRSYAGTLGALAAFRSGMSQAQVTAIEQSIAIAAPLCRAAAAGETQDPKAALTALRDELRRLLELEREVKA